MHDGAVIVRNDKCVSYSDGNTGISKGFGTRHRSHIGCLVSDAFVVSEKEAGGISYLTYNGTFRHDLTLRKRVQRGEIFLVPENKTEVVGKRASTWRVTYCPFILFINASPLIFSKIIAALDKFETYTNTLTNIPIDAKYNDKTYFCQWVNIRK